MIEWNKCYYTDCLDKNNGLPYLEKLIENGEMDKIDLCLTDPPYNFNYNGSIQKGHDYSKQIFYKDYFENYELFSKKWFNITRKICKKLIFTCGNKNLKLWFDIEEPLEVFIHYKKNCASRTSLCRFARYEPILLYGKFNHLLDFRCNVFDIPLENGFLNKTFTKHVSPKPFQLYYQIIKRLKNKHNIKTVIDPFLGSGTTAEVCTKLGIKWIGYEINTEYEEDINNRIKKCKKEPVQTNLFSYKNFELKV